jgi:hypothetical protein
VIGVDAQISITAVLIFHCILCGSAASRPNLQGEKIKQAKTGKIRVE